MQISRVLFVAAVLTAVFSCGSNSTGGGAGGSQSSGGAMGGLGGSGGGGGPAGTCHAAGTLNVTATSDNTAYVIDGVANPDLTLCRGSTYTFALDASGHPFYVKTVQGAGTDNAYDSGVTGNGMDTGTVVFAVPADAPSKLFYDCSIHSAMTGTIYVID